MSEPLGGRLGSGAAMSPYGQGPAPANLADILERVLDKGVVIAGDIQINLLDIELLTIKLRLLIASVDKAKEMGIDWWENDPSLSSGARGSGTGRPAAREAEQPPGRDGLAEENERLRAEIARLREGGALPSGGAGQDADSGREPAERTRSGGRGASGREEEEDQ